MLDEQTAILLVAASEKDNNMYYATRIFIPDAFIYLQTATEKLMVVGNLEIARARKYAKVDRVLPLVQYWKTAQDKYGIVPGTAEVADVVLKELGINKVIVPPDFSAKFADGIRQYGYTVEIKNEPFFEQRMLKDSDELAAMKTTIRYSEEALLSAMDLIKKADVAPSGMLMLDDEPLTSEFVRRLIHRYLAERDCVAQHTIVACGEQTSSPHEEGAGPLFAHQPIILDLFPRCMANGYFADMTRTVVRGKAPEALRKQYEAVLAAQEYGISLLKPGANGKEIHAAIAKFLEDLGYKTHSVDGKPQGFFHASGHGLGLEPHERPSLALRDEYIAIGNIVTVEPGLYYSGVGGVRIEDVIHVTDQGSVSLTEISKELEIGT